VLLFKAALLQSLSSFPFFSTALALFTPQRTCPHDRKYPSSKYYAIRVSKAID
jgi:hypothetical protein